MCRWNVNSYVSLYAFGCLLAGLPLGKCLCYCNVHLLYVYVDLGYVCMYMFP